MTSSERPETNANRDLDALAAAQARELLEILSVPGWKVWKPVPRDAELRKLLGRIHTAITEFQRLDAGGEGLDRLAEHRARVLLQVPLRSLSVDAALEVVDEWDQFLIENGDERYVRAVLIAEHTRDTKGTTVTTWSRVFSETPAAGGWEALLAGSPLNPEARKAGANQLAVLYRTRSTLYHLQRARNAMKGRYLLLLAWVLAALIAGLSLAIAGVGASWASIGLAALAGALGASVSGTLKLRDQVTNINDLRAFWPATFVQPLLGATAGLFLLLVLASGLITVDWGGEDWAVVGAIAFVAGFSEPMFLGIIGRVAAVGEPEEPAAPTTPTSA